MKKKLSPLHDFIKVLDIKLLMIRTLDPLKPVRWTVGLTDTLPANVFNCLQCENEEKAKELIDLIFERYEDVVRGDDKGVSPKRNIVYLSHD